MKRTRNWARLELPSDASLAVALPDTGDVVAAHVLLTGAYYPAHFDLALALTPADGVVLDLGAHLGTFALAAAASGRQVIAVEASPRNVELLRESVRVNGLDDLITVVPVAVGDRSGTVRFRQEGAWGRVVGSGGGHDVVEVPARTGVEILAELGVSDVDLVKMDVEGSEILALEGMATLLLGRDGPVVVCESNAHTLQMFDATPEDLIGALATFGYRTHLIGERELIPVTTASFQPETNVDCLAVKGDLNPPPGWQLRHPRTEHELGRVVTVESRHVNVHHRAQVARSLERAPIHLLARRDVQLALSALAIDPDETVARAASWWISSGSGAPRSDLSSSIRVRAGFHGLAEQGRALRDRFEQIRIRWGARP